MEFEENIKPWVSFCMSTYKRPGLLKQQLDLILKQQFKNFEIVISDNDPDSSAASVIKAIGDPRLKYFPNMTNIGMMKSFNKSIERSAADYVIMITDDDPVDDNMLSHFYELMIKYPGFGIYVGCKRTAKEKYAVEVFDEENFLFQILHPALTSNLLWSSCLLSKDILLSIGGVPDYGSPHLADHAMMALCGNKNGGVMINNMFSSLTAHDNNFSKSNLSLYYTACTEFYNLITNTVDKNRYIKDGQNALLKHLERWFLISMFSLRKYFTYTDNKREVVSQVRVVSQRILQLNFMNYLRTKYKLKLLIFHLKRPLFALNILR